LKTTVASQKAEISNVLDAVQTVIDSEKQSTDPTTQQLLKTLSRNTATAQTRYSLVKLSACSSVILL